MATEKQALPTDEMVLMQLCRAPKQEVKEWQGHQKESLTFMFQVADSRFPLLLKQGAWKTVSAFICAGGDGKRITGSYELLTQMNGRKLGSEWDKVDGWALTDEDWGRWFAHYPVLMEEPEFREDRSFKTQRIKQVFNMRLFPLQDRVVDINDDTTVRKLVDDARRAQLGQPVPVPLLGTGADAYKAIADFVAQKNGYGALVKAFLAAKKKATVGALDEMELKHLRVLLQIRQLWHLDGEPRRLIEEHLTAKQKTVHELPPMDAVTLFLASRQAGIRAGLVAEQGV